MKVSKRSFWSFIASILLFIWYFITPSEMIPDWFSYQAVYQNSGAWLSGRVEGIGFLFIISSFKNLSFQTAYEAFRTVLFLGFIIFFFKLVRGDIISFKNDRFWIVLFASIAALFLRASAQIREGIAMVLLLYSFSFMQKQQLKREEGKLQNYRISQFISWTFILISSSVHLSGAFSILIRIAGTFFSFFNNRSVKIVFLMIWIGMVFLILFQSNVFLNIAAISLERAGFGEGEVGFFTLSSLVYWGVNVFIWYLLFTSIRNIETQPLFFSKEMKQFSTIMAGPFAAFCLISIFYFKINGFPPVITVLFVRAFDFSLAISLLFVAMFSKKVVIPTIAIIFSAVQIAYQYIIFNQSVLL